MVERVNFTDMTDEHIEIMRNDMLKDMIEMFDEENSCDCPTCSGMEDDEEEEDESTDEEKELIAKQDKEEELEQLKPADPEGVAKIVEETGPDSIHCHEVMQMSQFLHKNLMSEVLQHPTIVANPEWFKLAFESARNLLKLHHLVGEAHFCEGDETAHKPSGILQ